MPEKFGVNSARTIKTMKAINNRPLYQVLADKFRSYILEGVWPVGVIIPSELELCEQFSASRTTVRRALENLTLEGYITRKPGKGTWVIGYQKSKEIWRIRSISPTYPFPESVTTEILATENIFPDPGDALLGAFEPNTLLTRIKILRRLKNTPFAYTDMYMRSTDADLVVKSFDPQKELYLFPVMERVTGRVVHDVSDTYTSVAAVGEMAARLNAVPGTPITLLSRVLTDADGAVLLANQSFYRPDLHKVRVMTTREKIYKQ